MGTEVLRSLDPRGVSASEDVLRNRLTELSLFDSLLIDSLAHVNKIVNDEQLVWFKLAIIRFPRLVRYSNEMPLRVGEYVVLAAVCYLTATLVQI